MKRNTVAGVIALASILFSACGTENDDKVVSLEPHPLESGVSSGSTASGAGGMSSGERRENGTASADSDNAPGSGSTGSGQGTQASGADTGSGQGTQASGAGAETGSADTYRSIYLKEVSANEGNTKGYSLILLDADDIPELVVLDREYDSYSIYTVKDGAAFCMADSMRTVEMTYFEGSGIIAEFDRWNGGGDEGGYGQYYYQVSREQTLTDEDQPLLNFSYNAVYNAEGVYTGEGVTEFYYMGQEIDEKAYQEMLDSLGIAEDRERVCTENICSREEMIGLLN